jgi:hypothetical protein
MAQQIGLQVLIKLKQTTPNETRQDKKNKADVMMV